MAACSLPYRCSHYARGAVRDNGEHLITLSTEFADQSNENSIEHFWRTGRLFITRTNTALAGPLRFTNEERTKNIVEAIQASHASARRQKWMAERKTLRSARG